MHIIKRLLCIEEKSMKIKEGKKLSEMRKIRENEMERSP